MTPIIPGNLPGLPEAWHVFYGVTQMYCPKSPMEYDLRIPADRCLVAFWMARVMGVPVGHLVPRTSFYDGQIEIEQPDGWHVFDGAPMKIKRTEPDYYPRAMATHALWLGKELRAGRITPSAPATGRSTSPGMSSGEVSMNEPSQVADEDGTGERGDCNGEPAVPPHTRMTGRQAIPGGE